jgi:DNA-binding NarL/FixJ family response regulator
MAGARVLLVEDHQVVREGLRALLSAQPDFEVVGEADQGEEALLLAESLRPQLVVMDLSLPHLDGVEATRRLGRLRPAPQVVILSMHDDAATVEAALAAGARGYVLKGRGIAVLCEALHAALRGEIYLSPELSERGLSLGPETKGPLSPREWEVISLIAEGLTGKEVAARLGLKPKTVENHRQNIMGKLNIHTTAGLVRYALGRRR